jgi:hypothetical protein
MKAPPITKENAAEFGRRGQIALRKKRAEQKAQLEAFLSEAPPERDDRIMRGRVVKQIDRIDGYLVTCKPSEIPKFVAAKARLWEMIYPVNRVTGRARKPAPFRVTDAAPGDVA